MPGVFSEETPQKFQCSRAKCTSAATTALHWRNPNIHKHGRSKTWLACPEHHAFLVDFLASRDFLLNISALETNVNTQHAQ